MIILAAAPACNCSTYLSTYFTYYLLTYLQLPTSLSETKPCHHIYDENDEPGSHPNEKNGVWVCGIVATVISAPSHGRLRDIRSIAFS